MKKLILFLIVSFASNLLIAQGCSDAGFCTVGSIKQSDAATSKQKLSLQLTNGIGDENVYVFTPGIQYDNNLNNNWAIQAKLTANLASGNLGTIAGLGDVFIAGSYSPTTKSKWKSTFILGTKLPLNNGDLRKDNKPYPMQYQSSLGTIDLIAGVSITNNKWLFATAIQQPLTGRNRNTFLPAYWANAQANKYAPSNDFNRQGDVLLRVGYTILTNRKFNFKASLLGIYHLSKDTYIDANISNKPIEINGSDGITLNGTFAASYKINPKFSIAISAGLPFVVRDVRPDGLTRSFSFSPEIIYHF
jgi:hypothetical protein